MIIIKTYSNIHIHITFYVNIKNIYSCVNFLLKDNQVRDKDSDEAVTNKALNWVYTNYIPKHGTMD